MASLNNNTTATFFLSKELQQLAAYVPHQDTLNKEVSQANVGWHIAHTLKVITQIHKALENADPTAYVKDTKFIKHVIFTLGKLPRGRAKSPKSVLPPDNITADIIFQQLKTAEQNLIHWNKLPADSFMRHPVFGNLKRDQAKRFVKIHTKHHLSIIRDILK